MARMNTEQLNDKGDYLQQQKQLNPTTIALAFGKPVAKNDAHVIRRRLPPLSPQIKNLRGPRTLETYSEADRSNECEIRTQLALEDYSKRPRRARISTNFSNSYP